MTPFLNKTDLSNDLSFRSFRSDFQSAIYDAFKFFLAFFGAFEMAAHVK